MSEPKPGAVAGAVPVVADAASAPGTGNRRGTQQEQEPASNPIFKSLLQAFAIWLLMQTVTNYFKGKNQPNTALQHSTEPSPSAAEPGSGSSVVSPKPGSPLQLVPVWPQGAQLDVHIQLSANEDGQVDFKDQTLPSVTWEGLEYRNTGWEKEWSTEFDVPTSVQHNGTLWADVFVTRSGHSPNPENSTFDSESLHVRKMLTRYFPYKKPRAVKNLMAGKTLSPEEEEAEAAALEAEKTEVKPIVSYYHQNLTLQMVCGANVVPYASLPPPLKDNIIPARVGQVNAAGHGFHYPITYANDFWLLREHMNPINETTTRLPLRVTLSPAAFWKFQIMASLDDSFNKNAAATGGGSELDEVKRMLTETSPILLITTVVVSVLHMLFEMLAFTSDVKHWRNRKDQVGVSLRTIISNVVVQLIILLYLLDNNENTSWMILFSQGTGLLIEAWKIQKVVEIKVIPAPDRFLGRRVEIRDKHVLSEEEKKTKEYDALAFKWVSWAIVPILGGFTIYSLLYREHRGWYSFIVTTLTSFVYAMSFANLVPQLIINYKLKSVAHIPLRALTYKFFATIVDDFFAFIIKQPILYRIAAFRDDVVFLILMYQMWIYKVDPNRENEYGQKLSPEEAAELQAKQDAAAKGEKFESKKDK